MDIHPVRTEAEYDAALLDVERLWGATAGTPESDHLEVLATLISAYEEQHHPILPPDPIDALTFYMEAKGLSLEDLEPCIGDRQRVEEVLNRKRALTIEMIRNLHDQWDLPADALIRRYPIRRARRSSRTKAAV